MNKKFLRKQNCGIPKSSVLLKSRRNVVDQSPLLSIINLNQKLLRRLKSPGSYCFFFSVTSLTKNFIEKSKTIKMPQNRARSVGYRSFLICNDPSGVVECRTVRTKNVIRKMEPSSDCRRFQKEQSNPSVCREERKRLVSKGNKEELHALPSSQLLEVSRGAQKINHMIDSWSRGLSFDGQSKDITRDLLKGALDLQESLIVLGKLQEASKYMAQLKKKQKPRSDQEGEMDIDRVDSGRFGDKDYQTRLQMSRLSVDDSSRECREELKKMIGDGIYRENLLSISKEEKTSCSGRKFGSTVDIPSTSSSQSVMVHSSRSTSAYCSPTQDKKAKSPNLIAKLMGLEELPPEQVQPSEKQVESEKSSNQQRHIFSTDMPKVRKTKSVDLSANPENRILNKIIEAMQFKEHLKNNCSEGYTHRSHLPNTSCSEQRFDYQIPPIVIIKPLHFPYAKTEGSLLGRFSDEEGAFDTKEILTKLEVKEEPSPKMIIREERAPGFKEMLGRLKVKKELPAEIVIGEEEILDQTQMLRKLEADEEAPTKRTIWEEGAKDPEISPKEPQEVKELKTKKPREPKVKVFKNKEKASPNKRKSYASLNQKPENKESTNQNAERTKMVPPDKRKPIEKDNVTSVAGKRYQNRAKSTSAKLIKPEIELIITKKQVFQQSTVQDPKSVNTTKPVLQNSTDQRKKNHRKKAIPVKDPTVNNSVMEGLKCKDCILTTTLADQVLAGEGRKGFEIEIEDHGNKDQNSVSEIRPCTNEHERGIKHAEEASKLISQETQGRKSIITKNDLKALLFSSPSFLSCVADLFDANVDESVVLEDPSVLEVGMTNPRLFLDYANELMEQKILQTLQAFHPLFRFMNPRISISLDKLVEEACDGVENLSNYNKIDGDVLPVDTLYIMLEKDLSCKLVLGGAWDLGWINGFSTDEADQVVGELEKQVLNQLIQEVVLDLMS